MSLPNPNKTVTEERLQEFYTQILPYLGGMPEAVCNKFSRSDLYSTTEKVIGCWIDGRPLYKKTIQCTMPQATTDGTEVLVNIATGISINECVKYDTYLKSSNFRDGNYVFGDSATKRLRTEIKFTIKAWYIEIRNAYVSANGWVPYVTLYYTKTTDAANSFKLADENDYSTTEKIIGTWIDGSYIYQKTIIDTMPTVTTEGTVVSKNIPIGVSVDTYVKSFVQYKSPTGIFLPLFNLTGVVTQNSIARYHLGNNNASSPQKNSLNVYSGILASSNAELIATLQYTKTTD